jgi:uncharacterized protein YcbK (DUF882 family)
MRALVSTLLAVLFVSSAPIPQAQAAQPARPASAKRTLQTAKPSRASEPSRASKEARSAPKSKTKNQPKRRAKPCAKVEAEIGRTEFNERKTVELLDCDGEPTRAALEHLSKLARHRSAHRPTAPELEKLREPGASPRRGVALLDVGLVARLAQLVRRFPGRELEVVSGFRPDSDGSQHQKARALDVVFRGVDNRELFEACKDLEDTGCGYYPNSSFVHVDVRTKGLGTSWIDASGPGQSPRYVARWSDGAVAGPKSLSAQAKPAVRVAEAAPKAGTKTRRPARTRTAKR